ncbi:L,D-transpeptidase family protein [Profundibacterium mesophilum]|uniref:Peptidoglycan-binding domain-containing protein Cell envelope biogenesis n=1 Tax=Profundibacterium mesophilum KAUST100406-0324 TaxID=1037889 RepID=A0A921NPU0_9RHOB|nr:L,D-transpeptidase family protein [Profundibacterium mesophilum]KAF0674732.1 putative peptidoglycan-binding domain-containing protein Cell envelope biogenesis [Profundibacterium mesophilum KAUST100406-0324]
MHDSAPRGGCSKAGAGGARLLRSAMGGAILAAVMASAAAAQDRESDIRITPFQQAVAEGAAGLDALADFYRETGYAPLWTGQDENATARRVMLLNAHEIAALHGLPTDRYRPEGIRDILASAGDPRSLGEAEIALSKLFVALVRGLEGGVLTPSDVAPNMKRSVTRRSDTEILRQFSSAVPAAFLRDAAPDGQEYLRLMREKLSLEAVIAAGGWGRPVGDVKLKLGDAGDGVVRLRDRLALMGYIEAHPGARYDAALREAVLRFQSDHGLAEDGVAGPSTLGAMDVAPETRLGQVLVAMERERWLDRELGARHIWVNLTDYSARIVDDGEVTFETRAVIGKDEADRETPEFSDEMNHMVINPSWYVPRSIVVGEYLPKLKKNPNALSEFKITDRSGREVNRARGFSQYTARSFPFSMRQPPSDTNALGLVKFMFPNKYNIYLHDTPAKSLFDRNVRAFSHGCVRLAEPFEFAYALLAMQRDDPEAYFQRILRSGREARVNLDVPVPVHLVYRTAMARPEGGMAYRDDIYGRDARILEALLAAGVELPANRS